MRHITRRWPGRAAMAGVAVGVLATVIPFGRAGASVTSTSFDLFPNAKFLPCLAAPGQTPRARVTAVRGDTNDVMVLTTSGFKSGLQFDVFTVERSTQLSNGAASPKAGVGLAWYQSDLHANSSAVIKTILLDQIFGFDPDATVNLAPTNTFHVGFWFNNPQDAAPCGFDVTHPTPFNGEHKAGPLAFISRPSAATNLGPLCTKPNTSTTPASCDG